MARSRAEDRAGTSKVKRPNKRQHKGDPTTRALLSAFPDAALLINREGIIEALNQAAAAIIGKSKDELIGAYIFDLLPPDLVKSKRRALFEVIDSAKPVRFLDELGDTVYSTTAHPILDDSGKVERIAVFTANVSQRGESEEEPKKSEQRYRTLFEDSPISLWEEDLSEVKKYIDRLRADGVQDVGKHLKQHPESAAECASLVKVTEANRMTRKMFQADTKQELLGSIDSLFVTESYSTVLELLAAVADGKTSLELETVNRTLKGEKRHVLLKLSVAPGYEKSYSKVLVSIIDINEKLGMEKGLLEAQKMDSIGILAGGIAHDFNNILTGILGNISLVKLEVPSGGKVGGWLSDAERAAAHAQKLARQLLTFSKGGAPVKKTTSIEKIIRDSADFALRGSNVKCRYHFPEDLYLVEIDEGRFSQVIQNLLINADQAMTRSGIITITAENATIEGDTQSSLAKGNYVKISIQDNGVGIPDRYIDRIFDPFFTTKSRGDGLGLAVSYSIVKQHEGYISVDSRVGIGTTLNVFIPASDDRISSVESGLETDERLPHGSGRILVLDDEEFVRNVTVRILEFLGYEVETVCEGAGAVEMYKSAKEQGRPFDAVILDLTVPGGMGGKDTIAVLKEIDPDVKAIVSSGYSTDPVLVDYERYGFRGYLSKPYRAKDLGGVLHNILKCK
jgi:PAS domain S-box-containing protein